MNVIEKVLDEILNTNEKISKPAKKWQNWWKIRGDTTCEYTNAPLKAGEILPGTFIWPSKEIAEQKAIEDIEYNNKKYPSLTHLTPLFLGAYPLGDKP